MAIKRRYRSRLARKESQRLVRQSVLIIILTIGLLAGLVVWGVPALVRFAGFLGEIRSSNQPIEANVDKLAPFAPQLSIPFEATPSARIDIGGFAEPGATVVVLNNGNKVAEVISDENGAFVARGVKLQEGNNEIAAQAIDEAGNESAISSLRSVIFDDQKPEIEIQTPDLNAERILSEEKLLRVSGKTEEGAKVFINERFARVGTGGEFSAQVPLSEGENKIKILAIDRAENTAEVEFVVEYYE